MMLVPPSEETDLDELEAMVDWGHLLGKRGTTTTQLTPSGKSVMQEKIREMGEYLEAIGRIFDLKPGLNHA